MCDKTIKEPKAGDLVEGYYFPVKLVSKINDDRLHENMEYCRASRHMFRTNDYKGSDFMSNNPDSCCAIIEAPEKHYMAKLVDGEWWWVDDCAQCCGHERNWMGTECEKHNVCRTCGTHRKDLTEAPWGGKHGWQCKPCAEKEHEEEKAEALAAMPEDYDPWDYHSLSRVKCPYCDYELSDAYDLYEANKEDCECPRCDNVFSVTAEPRIEFTCERKG